MNPPDIATIDLLWTLKGNASLAEVYAQLPERDDNECWCAYEHYVAACKSEGYFAQIYEYALMVRRTDRIMRYLEGDTRAYVSFLAREIRQPICDRTLDAALELMALMVEGFVRQVARGLSYPEFTPLDLAGTV